MSKIKYIIKRNGNKVPFDIQKIRNQTIPSCKGTTINSLELESQLTLNTNKLLYTKDIQEKLILNAKNNVNVENPDWDIVAGRLASYDLFRQIYKTTKIDFKEYKKLVEYLVRNKYYRKDLLLMMSEDEFNKISSYLKIDRDYNLLISQIMLLKSKYLIKNKNNFLEYPSTADMTNSIILASKEKDKVKYAKLFYDMLSNYYISLATPFKSNLRRPNGNTGSCYIGEFDDNLYNIFKSYTDMAIISKEGGGVGWYLGKIRPEGTYTHGVPKSNKINKWVKIINDIAVAVNQRGIRKGAITPALDWWHLDIVDFCEIKSELSGDLRDKAFDIFPQVIVDRYFIDAVLQDKEVYLFNQYEFKKLTNIDVTEEIDTTLYEIHKKVEQLIKTKKLKHYEKVKAKDLWKKFLKTWIEYGDFYIAHKDNLNKSNYVKNIGITKCANLCQESFSISKVATQWKIEGNSDNQITVSSDGLIHSCNLISINVANILNNDNLLKQVCEASVRMLDNSIDLGVSPVYEAKKTSEYLRNIGIGIVGLADYMAYNKVMYDTEEGRLVAERLAEKIAYYCYNASIDIAQEKGAYPAFNQANYNTLFGETPEKLNEFSKQTGNNFDWIEVVNKIKSKGIRNFYLLAYAPNTSSGLVQGVTPSYLPAYNKFNTQKLGDMIVPVLPKFIKKRFWYYKTKFQYKPSDIIKFTIRIQRWVDTGISMEVNINTALTNIKEISDAILDGFKSKELKAVYYSLTINPDKDENKQATICYDCAN